MGRKREEKRKSKLAPVAKKGEDCLLEDLERDANSTSGETGGRKGKGKFPTSWSCLGTSKKKTRYHQRETPGRQPLASKKKKDYGYGTSKGKKHLFLHGKKKLNDLRKCFEFKAGEGGGGKKKKATGVL